ncbi:MAG: cupin domain-containing protein [Candidatus Heimdallarchaeota archaeon]|nr:MAG: cupin domain-containing protein [Candidatus Heimdallarchaeota archaeon]
MLRNRFPDIIKSLPLADISMEGVKGWIAQGKDFQIVFFEIEPTGILPPHSHSAQWGIVVEGEMSLTIAGETKKYTKGDSYYIPESTVHQAEFHTKFRALDFFAEPERYKTKNE